MNYAVKYAVRNFLVLVTCAVIPLLFLFYICYRLTWGRGYEPEGDEKKFDRELWLQQPKYPSSDEKDIRWEMYDDLKENYLRHGMTRQEIIALLGEPNNNRTRWNDTLRMDYYIGDIPTDDCFLYIELDSNQRLDFVGVECN